MTFFLERLIAWRWLLLALGVALVAAAWFPAQRLTFDRSIENMFRQDDPLLEPYRRLKRTFGGNEIVLAVYVDPQLLDKEGRGFARMKRLREQIAKLPDVQEVLSLDGPLGEEILKDDRVATRMRKLFEGYTHGADGKTVALVCMLRPSGVAGPAMPEKELSAAEVPPGRRDLQDTRRETIEGIRQVMFALPETEKLEPGMITGEPVMIADGFRLVEEDGTRLGWTSTLLVALVVAVCFRSVRWVVIPVVVVWSALILTQAVLAVSGVRVSMVSTMLTAIVTVVGIATVVHIIVRFREQRRAGQTPEAALLACGIVLASPIFWSLLTDVAGFGSLVGARVGPVQDFGLMTAVGSLFVLIPCILMLPGLALVSDLDADPQEAWGEGLLSLGLERVVALVEHHPVWLGIVTVVVSGVLAAGAVRLEVESDFTKNFRADSPLVKSYDFVETRLGGGGVWDVLLPAPEKLDWVYLKKVLKLEERLRSEAGAGSPAALPLTPNPSPPRGEGDRDPLPSPLGGEGPGVRGRLTKVLSLADAVQAGSPIDLDSIPFAQAQDFAIDQGLDAMRTRMPAFLAALHSKDPATGKYWLRIMLRSEERQDAASKQRLIDQVRKIATEEFSEAEVTGFFVLLAHLIDSLLADQWTTFAIAAGGIELMLLAAFFIDIYPVERERTGSALLAALTAGRRSIFLSLAALVPNLLPIFIVTGLMGWLGLKINMGAVMIAAVSLGMSVDSSLHFITSFHRERESGKTRHAALDAVQQSVGRASVFSTLALIAGFLVLCTSDFVPTIYFGALVSLTMLGGLAGNLVLLPLILRLLPEEGHGPERS